MGETYRIKYNGQPTHCRKNSQRQYEAIRRETKTRCANLQNYARHLAAGSRSGDNEYADEIKRLLNSVIYTLFYAVRNYKFFKRIKNNFV